MVYRTANDWYERGYLIRRGERSHSRSGRGIAMFNRDQVRRIGEVPVIHVHHHHYH